MSKAVCIYCGKTMKMEAKDGYTYRCGECVEASFDAYKQNHDDKLRRLAQLEAEVKKLRKLVRDAYIEGFQMEADSWIAPQAEQWWMRSSARSELMTGGDS